MPWSEQAKVRILLCTWTNESAAHIHFFGVIIESNMTSLEASMHASSSQVKTSGLSTFAFGLC